MSKEGIIYIEQQEIANQIIEQLNINRNRLLSKLKFLRKQDNNKQEDNKQEDNKQEDNKQE